MIALVLGLGLSGALNAAPGRAQSAPIIIPPVIPIIVGVPGGGGRDGLIWSKSGRANVDIDRSQQHGRAAVH
jgi:hypothetical protein